MTKVVILKNLQHKKVIKIIKKINFFQIQVKVYVMKELNKMPDNKNLKNKNPVKKQF